MTAFDFRHPHPYRTLRPIFVAALAGLWILFAAAFASAARQTLHHELEVEILHDAKTLRGMDTIRLPKGAPRLRVALRPGVRLLGVEGATYTQKEGVLHLDLEAADPSSTTVVLRYEGIFDDPFEAEPFSMDNPGQGVVAPSPKMPPLPGRQRLVPSDPGRCPRDLSGVGDRAQGRLCGDGRQA